jgi:hypothetical protein
MHEIIKVNSSASEASLRNLLKLYAVRRLNSSSNDVNIVSKGVRAPFAFCSKMVNELRKIAKVSHF